MPAIAMGNMLGNGLRFSGTNQRVTLPYNAELDFTSNSNFTISTSFILNSFGTFTLFGSSDANPGYFLQTVGSNQIQLNFIDSNGVQYRAVSPINSIITGKLYHVVAIYSFTANTIRIYLDGGLLVSNGITPTLFTTTSPAFSIGGRNAGSQSINGIMHSMKVWKKSLDATDAIALYRSDNTRIVSPSDLVEAWDFEHKTGTVLSGLKGQDGTLTGTFIVSLGATNNWVDNLQQPILV